MQKYQVTQIIWQRCFLAFVYSLLLPTRSSIHHEVHIYPIASPSIFTRMSRYEADPTEQVGINLMFLTSGASPVQSQLTSCW